MESTSTPTSRVLVSKNSADLFRGTMDPIKKSILDANNKMDKSQIHDIILGGGSTRIPKVQKLLSDKV